MSSETEKKIAEEARKQAMDYLTTYEPPGTGRPMTKEEAEFYLDNPHLDEMLAIMLAPSRLEKYLWPTFLFLCVILAVTPIVLAVLYK